MIPRQGLPRSTRDGMSKNNGGKGRRSLPNNNGPKNQKPKEKRKKNQSRRNKKRIANALLQISREDKSSNLRVTAGEVLKNSYQSKSRKIIVV